MPSLLLSINIAGWHTSKQENTINQETPYILHIMHSKKGTLPDAPCSAVSIFHVINQVHHAINSSGFFQCAHRIIVTVVIGNI